MSEIVVETRSSAKPARVRLISKPEVLDRVGVTYPTLWAWMRAGEFPRSRELGGKAAWVESEVEAWILGRPTRQLKGDPGTESQPTITSLLHKRRKRWARKRAALVEAQCSTTLKRGE